ncbi:AMP-binding protein [Oceanicoccus sp. KOV_DT_Chl]|uniref:AMP-binding protein n=1 Tax=Oceanicoccus sp. KOV_DT_Chl TaxID=1904639 RepID=UPI000C7D83F0|nr:AMP-binding protein [Oceanicoccus sp. KOV_DT_Chl]
MRVIDFFDKGVDLYPNNLAFVEPGSDFTYREAAEQSHFIASTIRGKGYGKGSKIGILAPNCNLAFLALLGLFRSEAIWLPINPRNASDANNELVSNFGGELLFYHSAYKNEAIAMKQSVPAIRELVCLDSGTEEGESLAQWINDFREPFEMDEENPDDIMALFPTGGTTGKPKGVMITHKNVETFFANYWSAFDYKDNSRHLVVAPMTHSAGLLGCAHFARGGSNVMMAKADPKAIVDAIEDYGITHFFIPPTVLYMMLALPDIREGDYSTLKHIFIGAAPTSLEKLKEAIDVFGPVMSEAFGQTEAPASITVKAPWDYMNADGSINEARLQSIGRPAAFNKVAMLDDDGNEVKRGERGEICVKGDLVVPGYYQNPQATAEIRQFGWHHTGDIGVMDEDGFVTIVDRKKDMIISGGFNVFPNEIEQVITRIPEIQDCAVIGVPDEKWGEAIKAIVQLKPGMHISETEIIAFVKEKLGGVQTPKSVDVIDDLPRSPVGKVLKTELRKQYWSGQARAVN